MKRGIRTAVMDIIKLKSPDRWVYKRFFVADGNFKADHVRQAEDSDIWLSEGGGMFSKRERYSAFLQSAINRLTVGIAFVINRCR